MRKVRTQIMSMAAGIFDPALSEREDVESYYSAVADCLNMDPQPQGGAILRPGIAYYGRLRNVLAPIDLSGATVTPGAQISSGGTVEDPPPPPDPDPEPYGDGSGEIEPGWWTRSFGRQDPL